MWIPKTEQDIRDAVTNGSLEETVTFDGKRELSKKSFDIATDVSALANTAGGVLLYGLGEDTNGKLTILNPIKLKGERERIDQIIRTCIDEVPSFKITTIETQLDPTIGYLVVLVPPSERAPHMVIVKGASRFYGRSETGNYVLTQVEVARLYERRLTTETTILPVIEAAIKEAPVPDNEQFAHLHIVARPVLTDDTFLDRAVSAGKDHKELLTEVINQITSSGVFRNGYVPDIGYPGSGWIRRPEGYYGKCHHGPEEDMGVHCSRTLVETMHFSARLSVATHVKSVVEVVPDARRPTQRAHDNATYGTPGVGDEIPIPGAARGHQVAMSRLADTNMRRGRRANTEGRGEQRPYPHAH